MPVVPRIERPPTMPRRPLSVFAASASPPGIAISTSASAAHPTRGGDFGDRVADHPPRHRIDRRLARRNRQGRAASPCRRPRRRERSRRRPARRPHRREDSAPCVTSGSSPASLTTPAVAESSSRRVIARAKARPLAARQRHLDRIGKFAGRPARQTPPSPPRWRRCRWSIPGAMGDPARSMRHPYSPARRHRHHGSAHRMTAWDIDRRRGASGVPVLDARPCLACGRRARAIPGC